MTIKTETANEVHAEPRAEALRAAAMALVLGAALVFTIGFAHTAELHNAAHDTRHSLSFPCH